MTTLSFIIERHLWLVILLLIFLLPFVLLALRKLIHGLKLLGLYPRARQRKDWTRRDMLPEQVESHFKAIALEHAVRSVRRSRSLDSLHWQIYKGLLHLRRRLSRISAGMISLVPSSQWFFDNYNRFYREMLKLSEFGNLKKFRKLPVLASGESKGYPRIYQLARDIVSCSNNQLDEDSILRMLKIYQQTNPLLARELWALPDALTFALLERIVDLSSEMLKTIDSKQAADRSADHLSHWLIGDSNDHDMAAIIRNSVDQKQLENQGFVSHLYYRFRNMSISEVEFADWIAGALDQDPESCEKELSRILEHESEHESQSEAMIRQLVGSLNVIVDMSWEQQLQTVCTVDVQFKKDPADVYCRMDNMTRGQYRMQVEKLARCCRQHEQDVAAQITAWAVQDNKHIGEYLFAKNYNKTKARLSESSKCCLDRPIGRRLSIVAFSAAAGLLTLLMTAGGLWLAAEQNSLKIFLVILGIQLILISSSIAIRIIQEFASKIFLPKPQFSMDYDEGIPDEDRTVVVMPVLLTSTGQVEEYIDRMEKHYLANRQNNLHFAILGDFKDADSQTMPGDLELIQTAVNGVDKLNARYPEMASRFMLLYRPRQWNESESVWMGWERKRGKLEQLNALIMGERNTDYEMPVGSFRLLRKCRYVITLDADTELILESAIQLVAIMAHPLNRPKLDEKNRKVISGYTIVQPQIRNRMPGSTASIFSKLYSGPVGVDQYATVISDVYQDVFDQGTFVGKGIYDVQAVHRLLHGTIPENSVLSHDLLEGSLTRCAFASTVKMMDRHPTGIISYIRREHRWIRGDWQLLPWLFRPTSLNWLSKWKIIDNLRRSLVPIAEMLLILLCATVLTSATWLWLPFICFDAGYHILTYLIRIIIQKNRNPSMRLAFFGFVNQIFARLLQLLTELTLIPSRSMLTADAIIRTIYRMLISHRKLLEWQTAEAVERQVSNTLAFHLRKLWPAWLPTVALAVGAAFHPSSAWTVALYIIAAIWFVSPLTAYLFSQRRSPRLKKALRSEQELRLRILARRTWNFFEDFASEKTHWLCPDNYQQYPGPKLSDKTSPTNIGLQLLSTLSAHDFGFISTSQLIDICERILNACEQLPKWHGHLYNWYQIETLHVLEPQYISTVDSGNFTAHILCLKNGLEELLSKPILSHVSIVGLQDSLTAAGLADWGEHDRIDSIHDLKKCLGSLRDALDTEPVDQKWKARIRRQADALLEDAELCQDNADLDVLPCLADMTETKDLISRIQLLSIRIDRLISQTDFSRLFDKKHQLFSIGYHVSSQTADQGRYDLMASEARLTSFLAIAKGDVPKDHWYALGRPFTLIRGTPAMLSWSGSMFEYLMPNLVMATPPSSIFEQSCRAAVNRQIIHGRRMKQPWGVSESQYYAFDVNSNYQYTAFGVRRLKLQSTMRPARVVAPYATILGLMVKPRDALKNIDHLYQMGVSSDYGFFEALDFSKPDMSNLRQYSVVQSFMVHHLGMSLVAIDNVLNRSVMQSRFHREAMVRASEVLLEETAAAGMVNVSRRRYTININAREEGEQKDESRLITQAGLERPVVHMLGNRSFQLMVTSDGEGFSGCDGQMVNRWRPNLSGPGSGNFIYIRNLDSQAVWSNTFQPTCTRPDSYQAMFSQDKAEFRRHDGSIVTRTEITVAPFDNLEIKRVFLSNHGQLPVLLELTSYLEVVADRYRNDAAHPAFSKLFIETDYDPQRQMLTAHRRRRQPDDPDRYVMHRLVSTNTDSSEVQYEIDRRSFIGRNGSPMKPQALFSRQALSSHTGFSDDPILSLRTAVEIMPGQTRQLTFLTGFGSDQAAIDEINTHFDLYRDIDDIFGQALTSSRLRMRYLSVSPVFLNAVQNLLSPIYYPNRSFRGLVESIERNKLGQSSLWRFGISGDKPIVLLDVDSLKSAQLIKDTLLAFEVMRVYHVDVDLVIFNNEQSGYAMELDHLIQNLTSRLQIYSRQMERSGIYVVNRYQVSDEEADLLQAVASVRITPDTGLFFRHLKPSGQAGGTSDQLRPHTGVILLSAGQESSEQLRIDHLKQETEALEFANGLGGFADDGREYVIRIQNGMKPPAPWINVIANDQFGFQTSESGSGFTWAGNSHENKLTSWSNDPVLDPASEAIYIKDQTTGAVTSPCHLDVHAGGNYLVRHGFGYSVFEHNELGLEQILTVFAARQDPVRLWQLKLTNLENEPKIVSVTLYVEWLLGVSRDVSAPHVVTRFAPAQNCLFAQNGYQPVYRNRPAFIFCNKRIASYTGDRQAFLGPGESPRFPHGLANPNLSGDVGAGFDPCGAIQVKISLDPDETKHLVFGLGQTRDNEAASVLIEKYRSIEAASKELEQVKASWLDLLGGVVIHTPDRSLDILVNGWLRYQVLSCRLRARSAFYQCGGAIGFRDQLQDVLAFLDTHPDLVRDQILTACSRQFPEGDVQHWWHPPTGLGVRTRISDDLLWLPYVTCAYVNLTGDQSILTERVNWLAGDKLKPHEHERMITPDHSQKSDTVYQHCLKAIEHAARFGENGLPLIGGGDWNDGMNMIGADGRGESVWLGWFLYTVLHQFSAICREHGEAADCRRLSSQAANLTGNIESSAWDGQWYRRAYFDNGNPVGSSVNDECQIDSISQSWAVLSGAAGPVRAERAMASALNRLVDDQDRLILLLKPPFDKSVDNPGYIRGYYPGVRENGGQYTHAAIWLAMAAASQKLTSEAWRLLGILNPIRSTEDLQAVYHYEKEPYVMPADICSAKPHRGRAGWSWYTGSAGWMYQAILKSYLGIERKKDELVFNPCIAKGWTSWQVDYTYGRTTYALYFSKEKVNGLAVQRLTVDGSQAENKRVRLVDDGRTHRVEIILDDQKH